MRTISIIFVAVLVALLTLSSGAIAQPTSNQSRMVTVDVNQLPPAQRDSILQKEAQDEIDAKVKKYGFYAGLGKEIGEGVNESLKAITERTAEFAETKVGKFTMFMVAWKILGGSAIHFGFGTLFFLIWITIWIFSYYRNCVVRKVLIKDLKDGGKEWQVINEWKPNEGNDKGFTSALTHWGIFVVAVIITCFIIFSY